MIQNMFPGLRDLRAPLAAGYLLLASAWIVFRDDLNSDAQTPAGALLSDLTSLADQLGVAAELAAISFFAYLTGIVAVLLSSWPLRAIERLVARLDAPFSKARGMRDHRAPWARYLAAILRSGTASDEHDYQNRVEGLYRYVRRILRPYYGMRESPDALTEWAFDPKMPETITTRIAVDVMHGKYDHEDKGPEENQAITLASFCMGVVEGIVGEFPALVNRLQIKSEAIFDRHDRMMAESEFRMNAAIPLAALIVTLAVAIANPWLSIGLLAPLIIFVLGVRRYYEGRAVVWEALEQGLIESSTVAALFELIKEKGVKEDHRGL